MLWFEPDLYDMLQLAQILDRLLPEGAAELVIVGEEEFIGVAELAPDELRALVRGRRRSPGEAVGSPSARRSCDEGRAVWRGAARTRAGARSPRLAEAGTPDLPALGDAARRFLQQSPGAARA